jgi:hypothetical protein
VLPIQEENRGDIALFPYCTVQIASQADCAEHYRELATDTLARSETAGSADARMHYLLLAAHWYERALECERPHSGSEPAQPDTSH